MKKHRLSCEIPDHVHLKLSKILDHGEQKRLVNRLLLDFLKAYEKFGPTAKYAILAGKVDLLKLTTDKSEKNGND